ncbi:hypothetical protein O4J56_16905 [Nocardiopsis sp. RSe5-2]|uniref:Knr4/Smi1-like domain-containing protein n=1 Tax=Nocardiopsis endophytica TaxID=3018445 RepID=A0ABT4U5U3_9ACTN|nr:hypothetical protein [Nocardiopsis endophytica]MDA2812323.1 hypothetical protein [Nocardiopsis endophytica]
MNTDRPGTGEPAERRHARIHAKYALLERRGRAVTAARRPPTAEATVRACEEALGIELPESYRAFITGVADGVEAFGVRVTPLAKAWLWEEPDEWPDPAYARGPFPLAPGDELVFTPFGGSAYAPGNGPAFPWEADTLRAAEPWWEEVFGWREDDRGRGNYDLFPGLLMLGELGCGYAINIVFNGEAQGRVVFTWWREGPPLFAPEPDLAAWYESWLDLLLCDAVPVRRPGPALRVHSPGTPSGAPLDGAERAREVLLAATCGDGHGGDGLTDGAVEGALAALHTDTDPRVRLAAVCALSRGPDGADRLLTALPGTEGDPADLARALLAAMADRGGVSAARPRPRPRRDSRRSAS